MWLDYILFTHSSTDGHLGCFYLFTIVNSAVINICVQIFVWTPASNSFGSRIDGSYGNSMFHLWKKPPNCFPQELYHFTFQIAIYEGSNFSIFSFFSYLYFRKHLIFSELLLLLLWPLRWVCSGTSLCWFAFPSGQWWWASVHVLVGLLFIFFGEMST